MSKSTAKYDRFDFDQDPFSTTIADEETAARYKLVGRDEQEHQLQEFVEEGIRSPTPMKRRMIFGEYGTGKSHHLVTLRDSIRNGVTVDDTTHDAIAAYVGNLGLSIKLLYERILDEITDNAPELEPLVDDLPPVEPEASVDEAYKFERLQDNIIQNLRQVINAARDDHDYRAVFIFIDEAEDIANEDEEIVKPFVRAFRHLVDKLNAAGVHILLGFSQGARMRITSYDDDDDALGNALVQRFQGGEIYLGDLPTENVKEMLIDRMDQHRTTNQGEITPIVPETVEVVTEITGGHPREILRLYSEALKYAAEVESDRIDGEAIVYALTGFKSFTRDEELLDQRAITRLKNALEDVHPDARDDFDRLQGRLIGEGEAVPERAFSDGVPGELLGAITIEGEDTQELRVLEQREHHGRYTYTLSEEAQDFLFGGSSEDGTEIQKLDLQAQTAADKFQQDLTRGLGLALKEAGHGSLHKNPVTATRDRYEFKLYLINIKRDEGQNNQTVALGVYNGQEIPKELVQLYVETIQNRKAAFGVLVKQNQQLSAEANKYLHDLEPHDQNYYQERVIQIDITASQRDEFIYGRLLALGRTDTTASEDVSEDTLVNELAVIPELQDRFDDLLLPYPESTFRDVVDHLRDNSTTSFAIGDLRETLDLKQHELDSDIMQGLRDQSLVAKDSRRWTYPDLEDDRPPWYELYRLLNQDGPLTVDELQEQLGQEYVFDCPPGDENAMFQWYLDHLQIHDYVEPVTVQRDGKTIDAYDVVSVKDQFNETRQRAENRLEAAEDMVDQAIDLSVDGANNYQNTVSDLETELDDYQTVWEPDPSDLSDINQLVDDITDLEEDVENAIEERQEVIVGEAENLRDYTIQNLIDRIEEAEVEGSLAAQLSEYRGDLRQYRSELNDLIDNNQYNRLQDRTSAIETEVDDIESDIEDILEKKDQCHDLYDTVTSDRDDAEDTITSISDDNPTKADLESDLETLEGYIADYRDAYNAGNYDTALQILQDDAKQLATDLQSQAATIARQQRQYEKQLENLEAEIDGISTEDTRETAHSLLDDAQTELAQGNFAELPHLIDEIQDLLTGPTREEQFITALHDHDGRLTDIIEHTDFDATESFEFLQQLYQTDEIADIHVVIDDE
ncbi:AAA family ATPase [Natronobacterium texcoconense]|uniref:Orc1-like AAA ATPase domain-containing protein n=1 Tax=Natronobacterium texcoconense TaxID=1095778 RepID=A0A1H1AIN9_NATTX|nr:AAA family ATPase [Natronobacterium texcoconense]SDQ39504.1 hypothetical protein SAMN04489842_0707 [Natronobacterium texcoconense]